LGQGYTDKSELADSSKGVLLGDYRYDIYGPQVQTFPVVHQQPAGEETSGFSVVKLGIYSNYGHDDFTCVYRFRVHGEVA
jgi:SUN domain-containing protein 1/2